MMVLISTAAGYWTAGDDTWRLAGFLHTLCGTGLLAAGTAALNQWYERDTDALMRRTLRRPIPDGRIAPAHGLAFGLALSILGVIYLIVETNLLAAAAGLLTLASYLLVYTPLKRRSSICVFVGAAAGAMPPVIGYVAASGHLAWGALALFSILFVWQIPHVYAIAVMYRDDYDRGGLKMLPAASRQGGNPGRHIVAWSALLILASVSPTMLGIAGVPAALGGVVLALLFLRQSARFMVEPTTQRAREVLLASVVYLPLVLLMTVIGR
jgi:heme o synthase